MHCEQCRKDADIFVILPIKKVDGCLDTIVCITCAEESLAYCKKHKISHLGFVGDNTTACPLCINELVEENESTVAEITTQLLESLPDPEKDRLREYASHIFSMTGQDENISVLRAIATKAMRMGMTIKEVVNKIAEDCSVDFIHI